MVVPLQEEWIEPMERCPCVEADGICYEAEVEVGLCVELQLSGIFARYPRLAQQVVVQQTALCACYLPSDTEVVLCPSVHGCCGVGVHTGHAELA